jgi:hypothetical protein
VNLREGERPRLCAKEVKISGLDSRGRKVFV